MVNSVTFPAALGGDGKTYTDDADPDTGLDNLGYIERLVPMMGGAVAMAGYTAKYAAKIDAAAVNADRAEDARFYVEAVADAYRVNLIDAYRDQLTLWLNFLSGRYTRDDGERVDTNNPTDILSVKRLSPKWVIGTNGRQVEVAPNKLARQWDGGKSRGALSEGRATNLVPDTQMRGDPASHRGELILTRGEADPFGSNKASRIQVARELGNCTVNFFRLPPSADTQTTQCWVKVNKDDGGATQLKNRARGGDHFEGGWRLYTYTEAGNAEASRYFGVYSDATSIDITIAYPQVELGSEATSFVPTSNGPVTRAADEISIVFGNEVNQRTGTLILDLIMPTGIGKNILGFSNNSAVRIEVTDGQLILDLRGINSGFRATDIYLTPGERARIVLSYDEEEVIIVSSGVANRFVTTEPFGANMAGLEFGSRGGFISHAQTSIEAFGYIPRKLSEHEAGGLTP